MSLPPLIQALLEPSAYPEPPGAIEFKQTHISYLFFTQAYVYKIKKAVDFGFLNFTTVEKRKFFCHQEVALNRRLSPDVYIGVVEVNRENSRIVFEGRGEVVEYAVKMRRLPSDRMMDSLLMADKVTGPMVRHIANVIADFHRNAETNAHISGFGQLSVIEQNTEENFIQTMNFIGRTITQKQFDEIKEYAHGFFKTRHGLFAKRIEQGLIRDCHGDIHAEHICITNGIYIFDCIEFNERFRYSDTAADIAFLAMDLDFYNCNNLSRIFCDAYIKASGDRDAGALLDFYKCYRAYVRGKVEGFKSRQKEVPAEEKGAAGLKAKRYFHLAHMYATEGFRPMLMIICGLTGTGKTTAAHAMAKETSIKIISSDMVRKELSHIPAAEHRFEEFGKGIYAEGFTEKTYAEMLRRAEALLQKGYSVILDATFQKSAHRKIAMGLAEKLGAGFRIVECILNDNMVRERLEKRFEGEGISDGRWEIYVKQKEGYEPIKEPHMIVDTAVKPGLIVKEILDKIYA